jgi:hypothetical protein
MVAFLDGTVVNLALPATARDLGGGMGMQQWVVDGYHASGLSRFPDQDRAEDQAPDDVSRGRTHGMRLPRPPSRRCEHRRRPSDASVRRRGGKGQQGIASALWLAVEHRPADQSPRRHQRAPRLVAAGEGASGPRPQRVARQRNRPNRFRVTAGVGRKSPDEHRESDQSTRPTAFSAMDYSIAVECTGVFVDLPRQFTVRAPWSAPVNRSPCYVIADLDRGPQCRSAECHARQCQTEKHWPMPKQQSRRLDEHAGGMSHEFPRGTHGDQGTQCHHGAPAGGASPRCTNYPTRH